LVLKELDRVLSQRPSAHSSALDSSKLIGVLVRKAFKGIEKLDDRLSEKKKKDVRKLE
jgi:hypothetical protein